MIEFVRDSLLFGLFVALILAIGVVWITVSVKLWKSAGNPKNPPLLSPRKDSLFPDDRTEP